MASVALRSAVVLAGLIGLLLTLNYALDQRIPSIVAHNGAAPVEFGPRIDRGERVCSALGRVDGTEEADALQVTIGSFGAEPPPVRLTVVDEADSDRSSRVLSDYVEGVVSIPLPAGAERGGTRACLTNLGPADIVLAGQRTAEGAGSSIDGEPSSSVVSLRLVTLDPSRWSAVAGSVVERIGFGRGGSGTGDSGYVVLALFVLAFVLALGSAWRWAR